MINAEKTHTFAVCAYKESPYLEKCIESLKLQSIKSNIIICTATPNAHIQSIAEKYGIPVYINTGAHGIAEDWCFAYNQAKTQYVTLAHQDDLYDPQYAETVLSAAEKHSQPIIIFTAYYEVREEKKVYSDSSKLLKIKKLLLSPLNFRLLQNSRWVRRRILSLGSPIGCPAVTYNKNCIPDAPFTNHYICALDWETWEMLSRKKGAFVYISQPMMGHRIHEESTTTLVIGENSGRKQEDLEMYCKFWPKPIARAINHFYADSQKSNEIKHEKNT